MEVGQASSNLCRPRPSQGPSAEFCGDLCVTAATQGNCLGAARHARDGIVQQAQLSFIQSHIVSWSLRSWSPQPDSLHDACFARRVPGSRRPRRL